jgi:hypothetical protein
MMMISAASLLICSAAHAVCADSISQHSAPSTTAVEIEVRGSGFIFPGLPGGVCSFTLPSRNLVITKPLHVVSNTSGVCTTPAAGISPAVWTVNLMYVHRR